MNWMWGWVGRENEREERERERENSLLKLVFNMSNWKDKVVIY